MRRNNWPTSFFSFCLALLEFSLSKANPAELTQHEPQHLDERELWNGSGEEKMGKEKMQGVVTQLYLLGKNYIYWENHIYLFEFLRFFFSVDAYRLKYEWL